MDTSRPTAPDGASSPFATTLSDWFTTRDPGVWLVRIGLLLLAGAGGWFIRYAVVEGWVGPVTRLVLVAMVAVLLVAIGDRIRDSKRYLATALTATGVALGYFVTVAAAQDLGTPLFLTLVTSLALAGTTVLLAFRLGSALVAATGLLAASIAPTLVALSGPTLVVPYSLVLLAAAAYLYVTRGWATPAAGVVASLSALGVAALLSASDDPQAIAVVLGATWLTSVGAATFVGLAWRGPDRFDLRTAVLPVLSVSTVVGAVWSFADWWNLEGPLWGSGTVIAAGGAAAVHLIVTLVVGTSRSRHPDRVDPIMVANLVTSAFAASVAVTDLWSWRTLPSVLTLYFGGLVVWGVRRDDGNLIRAGLLALIPVVSMWAWTLDSAPDRLDVELATGGVIPLALTALAVVLAGRTDPAERALAAAVGWSAVVTGTGWTLVVSSRLEAWAGVLVTLLWMLVGTTIAAASLRRSTAFGGVALVGAGLAKLVLQDTIDLPPVARVAIYAALGAVLVTGGAWALRRSKRVGEREPEVQVPAASAGPEPEARG